MALTSFRDVSDDGQALKKLLSAVKPSDTQKRTLSKYPMDFQYKDTLQFMSNKRQLMEHRKASICRASVDSDNMYQYGKELFQNSINLASRPSSAPNPLPHLDSLGGRTHHLQAHGRPRTGPTIRGSPIYNCRMALMNEIRIRPKTAYANSSRNHSVIHEDIQDILQQSNSSFKVSTLRSSCTHSSTSAHLLVPSYKDFILVPLSKNNKSDCFQNEQTHTADVPTIPPNMCAPKSTTKVMSPEFEIVCDFEEAGSDEMVVDGTKQNRNSLVFGNLESMKDKDTQTKPVAETDSKLLVQNIDSAKAARSKTPAKRERKVTWVDDETVSSTKATENKTPQSPDPKEKSQVDIKTPQDQTNIPNNEDMDLEDVQDQVWTLPDFICPSSEEKSREARTRSWLGTNSFSWASRSVPLL